VKWNDPGQVTTQHEFVDTLPNREHEIEVLVETS